MLQLPQIKARIVRLQELSMGLAKEATAWRAAEDPLLYLERKAYVNALLNALAGMEEARAALAMAAARLERKAERRTTPIVG